MCGIVGIYGLEDVVEELYRYSVDIQHRGRDSCGITTCFNNTFIEKKGLGLVKEVFKDKHFGRLRGNVGLGHVRYATVGAGGASDAQPFHTDSIMLAHNGNLTNNFELKDYLRNQCGRYPNSNCDSETILHLFADELYKRGKLCDLKSKQIRAAIKSVMNKAKGSYSVISYIKDKGFVAFRDPKGIKPIVAGRRYSSEGVTYIFASEDRTFDKYDYERWGDLKPGEAVFIDVKRKEHVWNVLPNEHRPCIFEYVYFAKGDSRTDGIDVCEVRRDWGMLLAKEFKRRYPNLEFDLVSDIPSTSEEAALGFSSVYGGDKYKKIFEVNQDAGRSFIQPTYQLRKQTVDTKINVMKNRVRDKRIVIIDDSLIRGITSKAIVQDLRKAGAKEIYLCIYSPPVKYPCVYGIDMQVLKEFIAGNLPLEKVADYVGVDILFYQPYANLHKPLPKLNCCDACFTNNYPTDISDDIFRVIEEEREKAKNSAINTLPSFLF
ncbi:amidophosphoribosyltransferase [Candidatus Woesearchaeota archaeon]|nr:amidophosphoribosyltransferase [Candidatus Woesearchaeota archaeon]